MKAVFALDDALLAKAQEYTGLDDVSDLVREALIQRESAKRLAQLGGSEPELRAPPRRRPHA